MKSTFLESAILICIPMLVFGTSFAINLDGDIRSDWKEWSMKLKFTRLYVGIILGGITDYLFLKYPLWHPVY